MSDQRLHVSDHALLRFLERAGGHDIATIREALSRSLERARAAASIVAMRDYTVIADGLTYVVKNDVVVTVLDRSPRRTTCTPPPRGEGMGEGPWETPQ